MSELLSVPWPMVIVAFVVWGPAPPTIVRIASRLRGWPEAERTALLGELYRQPRLDQPFWALQQLEASIVAALAKRVGRRRRRRRRRNRR